MLGITLSKYHLSGCINKKNIFIAKNPANMLTYPRGQANQVIRA